MRGNGGRWSIRRAPGVARALVPEVPQQLFVLWAQTMKRVGPHNSSKLLLQVVGHLSLPPLAAPRRLRASPRLPAHSVTLGQHHGVAVLIQQNGDGHGGRPVRVGGRGQLVGVDAAAALFALLWHLPHVEDELALAEEGAVVDQQQVDVVQEAALGLTCEHTGGGDVVVRYSVNANIPHRRGRLLMGRPDGRSLPWRSGSEAVSYKPPGG